MAKPIGPDFIALQVRDLAASTRFYAETFGFQAAPKSPPGAVVFDTKPIALAIRKPFVRCPRAARWASACRCGSRAKTRTRCTTSS